MKTLELLLYKPNPDRIPGRGGEEYVSKVSGIMVADPESLAVGDKVIVVDSFYNRNEFKVDKIRWDKKAFNYSVSTTLSFGGNPFGASSGFREHEFEDNYPVFADMKNADKFAELAKSESGYDCDHPKEWRIVKSYYRNRWV